MRNLCSTATVKKTLCAGCLALALLAGGPAAQAQEFADESWELLFEMVGAGQLPDQSLGPLADDSAIGICLLSAAVDGFAALSACDQDPYCSTAAIFSLIIDALLCTNPEDENIVFLLCASDAVVDYFARSALCEQGEACQIQNLLTLAMSVIVCSAGTAN